MKFVLFFLFCGGHGIPIPLERLHSALTTIQLSVEDRAILTWIVFIRRVELLKPYQTLSKLQPDSWLLWNSLTSKRPASGSVIQGHSFVNLEQNWAPVPTQAQRRSRGTFYSPQKHGPNWLICLRQPVCCSILVLSRNLPMASQPAQNQ